MPPMTNKTGRGRIRKDYSRQAATHAKTIQALANAESERQSTLR